jgi:Cu-processing system permease protein
MKNILKYSFYEMIRSRWAYIYTAFYLLVTFALLYLSYDTSKVIISMTNITLILAPLIGILFGTTYYYNSREFIELLLAQPLSRMTIFFGMYGGLAITLCISLLIGIGVPLIMFGVLNDPNVGIFWILLLMSCILTVIFSLLAFAIAIRHDDKVKGLSLAIFFWLLFAVIYDGVVLLLLLFFKDYPLDQLTIGVILANPIDLARIMIITQLDISAMMGYTGAVISKFIGKGQGMFLIACSLVVWTVLPMLIIHRIGKSKDF